MLPASLIEKQEVALTKIVPVGVSESRSGSRRAKMTHNNRKKYRNFMF